MSMIEDDLFDSQVDRAKAYLITLVFVPMIVFTILYLLGSFTAGSTNPLDWTVASRAWLVLFWLVFSFFGILSGLIWMSELAGHDKKIEYWKGLHSEACMANAALSQQLVELEDAST